MPTVIDAGLHEFHEWIYRFHPATGVPSRLLLLLHGWTGDENSMWVFTRKLPAQVAILAPRGVYIAPEGGYTWRESQPGKKGFPGVEEFRQSAEALVRFVDEWSSSSGVIADQFDLIGFSQGASLTYSLALLHPERIRAMAALSGFMPPGAKELLLKRPLAGKPIFVAHGRQDNMVPVELARKAVALLEGSGARVTYFESDGGHKVSLDCYPGLEEIFG